MKDSTKQNLIRITPAVLVPLVCYLIFAVTGNMYTYTDNVTVAVVVNGMYGDNNFCQYLHPLFCLIVKWLNPLLPTADVFTLLIHVALLYSVGILTYIAVNSMKRKSFKMWRVKDFVAVGLMILAITYSTLGMNLFGVNYTVQTAAIIMAGTLILFYSRSNGKGRFWIVSGTVLISFGFLIRLEAALLFIPFILLEIIIEYLQKKNIKEQFLIDLRTIFPCIAVILVILLSRYAFTAIEPYATDSRYNEYRTIAEDYWMKGYNRHDPAFEGLDQSTYDAARSWILIDTDRINVHSLEKIASAGSGSAYVKTPDGVKYAIRAMYRRVTQEDLHLLILTVIAIVMTLWNAISAKTILLRLETLAAFFGGFIILFYFTFIGRAPMRVWQCVLMAALTILILVAIKNHRNNTEAQERRILSKIRIAYMLLLCVILYFGIGQVFAVSNIHSIQTPLTSRIGANDKAYEKTFEGDSLFIWPNWYAQIPDYFSKQNKLPTQRVIDHNIAMGDWVYGQIYFKDFLDKIGAPNPAIALLERPNTFLVKGQEKEFLSYMQEHYGEDIQLELRGRILGKKYYSLKRVVDEVNEQKIYQMSDSEPTDQESADEKYDGVT